MGGRVVAPLPINVCKRAPRQSGTAASGPARQTALPFVDANGVLLMRIVLLVQISAIDRNSRYTNAQQGVGA